jgi:hypothetical protein
MEHYDPYDPPDPKAWLDIDEAQRIHLAEDYHRRAGIRLPNVVLHAIFHVFVENHSATKFPCGGLSSG